MTLPDGWWEDTPGGPVVQQAHKTFADGTDVILSVVEIEGGVDARGGGGSGAIRFELSSSTASPTSDPVDTSLGIFTSVRAAQQALLASISAWDEDPR